jgi:carbamoyltransferase
MSTIVGINAFGQNPSACLVIDGKLVSFSHEERFTRIKGSEGLFPGLSLAWCLASNKLNLADVDRIAVNWNCNQYPWSVFNSLLSYKLKTLSFSKSANTQSKAGIHGLIELLNRYSPSYYKQSITDSLRMIGLKGTIPDVEFVGHHLSHAYQTYYQSSFDNAIVLVADGHGEIDCISGYAVQNGDFKRILHYPIPYSLGWFYGAFTAYLGFRPNSEEGKLMGLAAYGECRKDNNPWLSRLDKIIKVTGNGLEINPNFFKFGDNDYHPRYTNALVEYITSFDKDLTPVGLNDKCLIDGTVQSRYLLDKYIDLAYAVQTRLEEVIVSLVKEMVHLSGIRNLCLAGGVFMNCKANGSITDGCGIENVFIHPAASDDGSAIGAAFYVAKEFGYDTRNIIQHVQYGASYTNDDVINHLNAYGISYKISNDISQDVAKLIGQGKFVGWFNGASEMGARALGGRSIIASPIFSETKQALNKQVKRREFWRPYCPSLTFENQANYIQNPTDTPFMICTKQATKLLAESAPAIVHVDNTVRPQSVKQDVLPKWHHLIEAVAKQTGHPILLNTSFNGSGEPIVNSPHDAIRTFFSTGLHALAMEDVLITKS